MRSDLLEMQWSHDPTNRTTWKVTETDGKTYYKGTFGDGWESLVSLGGIENRCEALHPSDPRYGSCGALAGHEHPHIWCWPTWHVESVVRRCGTVAPARREPR